MQVNKSTAEELRLRHIFLAASCAFPPFFLQNRAQVFLLDTFTEIMNLLYCFYTVGIGNFKVNKIIFTAGKLKKKTDLFS